jgi:DNA gyrase subunit B
MATTGEYTAESIEVLRGLEPVRRRPGMYVGDTDDGSGMHHMLWELLGAAIDECRLGYAKDLAITIDGSRATIEHSGRAIPLEAIDLVMTSLHGWRWHREHIPGHDEDACASSHPMGLPIVTALSTELELTLWRDGHEHGQRYTRGERIGDTESRGPTTRTGTRVSFVPDFTIFKQHAWNVAAIAARCRTIAGLLAGKRIAMNGDTFHYASLGDYIAARAGGDVIDPFVAHGEHAGIGVDVAIAWRREAGTSIESLVNWSACEKGPHVTGLFAALKTVLAPRMSKRHSFDKRITRGMVAMLHVRVRDPRFTRQTKDTLANPEVADAVRAIVERELPKHFERTPALLDTILMMVD